MVKAMTIGMFFDYMGVRLNGPKAAGKTIVVNWNFIDEEESLYVLTLENSVLSYAAGTQALDADVRHRFKVAFSRGNSVYKGF